MSWIRPESWRFTHPHKFNEFNCVKRLINLSRMKESMLIVVSERLDRENEHPNSNDLRFGFWIWRNRWQVRPKDSRSILESSFSKMKVKQSSGRLISISTQDLKVVKLGFWLQSVCNMSWIWGMIRYHEEHVHLHIRILYEHHIGDIIALFLNHGDLNRWESKIPRQIEWIY